MKAIKLLFTISMVGISSCFSCEKMEVSYESKWQIEPDDFYLELKRIGDTVMSFIAEPGFREFIYKEVEKRFDGDYNVLINKVQSEYLKKKKSSNIELALSYFENLNVYPQIFIPFYEDLKRNNKLASNNPIMVIYIDETETDEYTGYRITKKGLEKLDFMISEEFAKKHEIWVFSINERVNKNGDITFCNNDNYSLDTCEINGKAKSSTIIINLKALADCVPPGTPTNVEALPYVPYSIRIKWMDALGVTFYKIFREDNYSGIYDEITTVNSNMGATYLDTGLNAGAHYDYQIQAFNGPDCFSTRTYGNGGWASWRMNNNYEFLNKVFISDRCWSWCCGWPEGNIELMYRLVKYNKSDQQVEYPRNSLDEKTKNEQKGKWCTYDKELFRWDINKYAYNYLLFFYEDDRGDDKGVTIKLSAGFEPNDTVKVGAEVSFTIDDKDEELGWIEIYHFDSSWKVYSLAPRKGSAQILIRQ